MIEFCTKRRMILTISILTCLSLVALYFENRWSSQNEMKKAKLAAKKLVNVSCPDSKITVLESCKLCPRDENRQELSFCKGTGFKEFVQCSNGKKIFQGCDPYLPEKERKSFWMFEGLCFVIFLISFSVVQHRQKILSKQVAEKINRQIASGL